jgi:hypothetical protein
VVRAENVYRDIDILWYAFAFGILIITIILSCRCTKSYSEKGHPEYVLDALISVCESTKVKDVPGCEEIPECRNDGTLSLTFQYYFA